MSRTPPEGPLAVPPLVVSMGDAAGIGPECIARAFVEGELHDAVVVGDAGVMRRALTLLGGQAPVVAVLDAPQERGQVPAGCLPLIVPPGLPAGLQALPYGRVDARAGDAAARCVAHAVQLVQRGAARALVTAPLSKEALAAAGIIHPGHTEMLQDLAAAGGALPPVRMMLANEALRVVLVTIHLSLRQALDALGFEPVLQTLRIAHRASALWGQPRPRIAVAGLNPHAGEGGLFGTEEIDYIAPAVQAAQREGIDARGPFAPDTVFMRARNAPGRPGEFDLVVAMTHDHGLIPIKYLGVEQGVNVTLGLPFIRTSPDHGTAFDIAGRGVADPSSLKAALRSARSLAPVRALAP